MPRGTALLEPAEASRCPTSPPIAAAVVSSPNPTSPMPRWSVAYRTSTDQAAPNVMLKLTITSASVRTGGCPQQPAERPRPCPGAGGCAPRARVPCGGSVTRTISSTAISSSTVWATNGQTSPSGEQGRPERRPDELVDGDEAGQQPGVGDAQVGGPDQHRR